MQIDYTAVTELPGHKASKEQLAMIYGRYRFASTFCKDKNVLEVGCGAGIGSRYLADIADRVVGGDFTESLLAIGQDHNRNNLKSICLDAHRLPFKDNSFDVIISYEVIYYLNNPVIFLEEAQRVLKNHGKILISTVNKSWAGFYPSPYSTRYFLAPELFSLLNSRFTKVEFYAAFSAHCRTTKDKVVSSIRKLVNRLHLIPKTMKGKAYLKRIFYGKLLAIPEEIVEGMVDYTPPVSISPHCLNSEYKILYGVGYK